KDVLDGGTRARFRELGLLGESPKLYNMLTVVARAARSGVTVLLQGETGTGKELVARAIHQMSDRRRGAFVPGNCAAISETLLESELFGHTRGAFSGADRDRGGLFEEAERGTLLLDEVSEIPLPIQVKLLRALQDGEIRPVGASRCRRVDVRVIAAANRDLGEAVAAGVFRRDLYHRLNVYLIHIPTLRTRRGDIALLTRRFVTEFSVREGRSALSIDPEVVTAFEQYPWPGNVRELRNQIHQLVLGTNPGGRIGLDMLPSRFPRPRKGDEAPRHLKDIVRNVELALIQDRLREHGY